MDRDAELRVRQPDGIVDDDLELGAYGGVSWYLNREVERRIVARFDAVFGERRGPIRAYPVVVAQRRVVNRRWPVVDIRVAEERRSMPMVTWRVLMAWPSSSARKDSGSAAPDTRAFFSDETSAPVACALSSTILSKSGGPQ